MAGPTHVPKFGKWDGSDRVTYTAVFEDARAQRGGKPINPLDSAENPDLSSEGSQRSEAPPFQSHGQKFHQQNIVEDGSNGIHLPSSQQESRRNSVEINAHDSVGVNKPSVTGGSLWPMSTGALKRGVHGETANSRENSNIDRSPLHQAYRGRLGNKPGSASPAWGERRASGEWAKLHAPATPGRSPMRGNVKGDEMPDRGPALPKFGEWNEKDPSSADSYTIIFGNARNEKKTGGSTHGPGTYGSSHKQYRAVPQNKRASVDLTKIEVSIEQPSMALGHDEDEALYSELYRELATIDRRVTRAHSQNCHSHTPLDLANVVRARARGRGRGCHIRRGNARHVVVTYARRGDCNALDTVGVDDEDNGSDSSSSSFEELMEPEFDSDDNIVTDGDHGSVSESSTSSYEEESTSDRNIGPWALAILNFCNQIISERSLNFLNS